MEKKKVKILTMCVCAFALLFICSLCSFYFILYPKIKSNKKTSQVQGIEISSVANIA